MRTRTLCEAGGVEVTGIDLREELADSEQRALRDLLDAQQLLVFRDQELEAADQVRVLGLFGPVTDEMNDGSYQSLVSNVRSDGVFGRWNLPFHSDFEFTSYQPPVLSLYGLDVEPRAEPTMYVNCVSGCRTLPMALRAKLEQMSAVHANDLSYDKSAHGYRRFNLLELPEPAPPHQSWTHPVIRPHPRTGVPVIYVSENFTSHLEGMSVAESESRLQEILRHLYSGRHTYTHNWAPGDLVIWDNVSMQHGRRSLGDGENFTRRTLRRVTVSEKSFVELTAGRLKSINRSKLEAAG